MEKTKKNDIYANVCLPAGSVFYLEFVCHHGRIDLETPVAEGTITEAVLVFTCQQDRVTTP